MYNIHTKTPSNHHFSLQIGSKNKISLKNFNKNINTTKHTDYSTTCNSVYRVSQKKSIKELVNQRGVKPLSYQYATSIKYEDIKCMENTQRNVFEQLFCFQKKEIQKEGCKCEPKCLWINYWLGLSKRTWNNAKYNVISEQTQQQIRKDILRTQPNCIEFQKLHYQEALYQCLINYARLDPEVGYVQGLNIISSVIIYHANSLEQSLHVLKFLMIQCKFRDLFLEDFKLAHKISEQLEYCLRYRCNDIYTMFKKYEINLSIFVIGWLIPLLGNIMPLEYMHLVINTFIEKSWQGIIKIIISMLLYLRVQILSANDQAQLMYLLSTQKLRGSKICWEDVIRASFNLKNLPNL